MLGTQEENIEEGQWRIASSMLESIKILERNPDKVIKDFFLNLHSILLNGEDNNGLKNGEGLYLFLKDNYDSKVA